MVIKKKKSLRLVPLRIMVSTQHLEYINTRADTTGNSQGSIIRELIDKEIGMYAVNSKKGE